LTDPLIRVAVQGYQPPAHRAALVTDEPYPPAAYQTPAEMAQTFWAAYQKAAATGASQTDIMAALGYSKYGYGWMDKKTTARVHFNGSDGVLYLPPGPINGEWFTFTIAKNQSAAVSTEDQYRR
jgi:hypothetical protein